MFILRIFFIVMKTIIQTVVYLAVEMTIWISFSATVLFIAQPHEISGTAQGHRMHPYRAKLSTKKVTVASEHKRRTN